MIEIFILDIRLKLQLKFTITVACPKAKDKVYMHALEILLSTLLATMKLVIHV